MAISFALVCAWRVFVIGGTGLLFGKLADSVCSELVRGDKNGRR